MSRISCPNYYNKPAISNPGPGQCKDCGKVFCKQSTPVQCSECGEQFRKVAKKGQPTTCSGHTRWKLEDILEKKKALICRICKGETPRAAQRNHPDVKREKCSRRGCKTKQKMKDTDDILICISCKKQFHLRIECSGMSRKQRETLQEDHWICLNCEEDDEEEADNVEEPTGQETQYKQMKTRETTLKIMQLNIDSIL